MPKRKTPPAPPAPPGPLAPTPDPVITDNSFWTPDAHECFPRMTQEPDPVRIEEERRLAQSGDDEFSGLFEILTDILTEVREINQTLKRYCR